MAVESATYIGQLNTAYPAGGEPIAQGDDHLRLIKTTLLNTFPNLNAPLTATWLPFTPTADIAATNVQAAIQELDTEKVAKAGDTMTGSLTLPRLISGNGSSDPGAGQIYAGGSVIAHSQAGAGALFPYYASAANNCAISSVSASGAMYLSQDSQIKAVLRKDGEFAVGPGDNPNAFGGFVGALTAQYGGNPLAGITIGTAPGGITSAYSARMFLSDLGTYFDNNSAVRDWIFTRGSGTAYATVTAVINNVSDYRIKENVIPLDKALDRLALLKPVRFTYKEGSLSRNTYGSGHVDGFIAHEVTPAVPEAVHGVKDAVDSKGTPVLQGLDYVGLVPLLTAAIQELSAKVAELEARLA